MSDEENKNEPGEKPKAKPRRARGAWLAVFLALVSLGANGYLGWYLFVAHPLLFRNDIPARVTSLRDTVAKLKDGAASARTDIDQLKQSQETLNEALRKTSESLGRNRRDWIMAESEQLMIVANQRLQLAGDFDTATAALEIADQRLRSLADPDLLPVRKELVKEIDALKSTERVDIAGIALKLANLAETVEHLPLSLDFRSMKTGDSAPAPNESDTKERANRGFFQQLWADIRGLITFRSNVETYRPLLPPKQQYFLRENLRLVLLGAQQAALRADRATYRSNLESASRWIKTYFDPDAQAVKEMQKQVQALARQPLTAKRPDIGASLKALRIVAEKHAGL
jgi:uroporphyrin-3 C-methyltransferase